MKLVRGNRSSPRIPNTSVLVSNRGPCWNSRCDLQNDSQKCAGESFECAQENWFFWFRSRNSTLEITTKLHDSQKMDHQPALLNESNNKPSHEVPPACSKTGKHVDVPWGCCSYQVQMWGFLSISLSTSLFSKNINIKRPTYFQIMHQLSSNVLETNSTACRLHTVSNSFALNTLTLNLQVFTLESSPNLIHTLNNRHIA